MAKLKRLVRYLKRERQWGQLFRYGKIDNEVTTVKDSDWAGCKETRKSSSAGVIQLGKHTLKAYTRTQKIIAKKQCSSGTARSSFGSIRVKGHCVTAERLMYELKPVLAIVAKATEHILHRQATGKLKHIDVAYFMDTGRNPSVCEESEVKRMSQTWELSHCLTLGYTNMAEQSGSCRTWRRLGSGSIHMFGTGATKVSLQNSSDDHVAECSHRDSS